MLLELKRPAEALAEYQVSAGREPGRFRGLSGLTRAAAASGDSTAARRYAAQLIDAAGATASRADLALARALVQPQR
jgi:hypothetical protein